MTVSTSRAPTLTATQEPFVGPGPFEEDQEWLFFGRAAEIEDLLSLIWAHPIVLLYAPSGCGKSSLLSAGVAPNLRRQYVQVLPIVRVHPELATDRFGALPNKYVGAALSSLAAADPEPPRQQEQTFQPASITAMLGRIPRGHDEHGDDQVRLMILDQFEEILAPFAAEDPPATYLDHQAGFFSQITEALADDQRLRTVFAIREDYLGEIERLGLGLPRGFCTRYRLDFLGTTAAFDAIVGPTQPRRVEDEIVRAAMPPHFNTDYAHELVNQLRLTPKVGGQPSYYVEPAELQVVCRSGWRTAADAGADEVTPDHIPGEVGGALRRHYESAIGDTVARWQAEDWPKLTGPSSQHPPPPRPRATARWWRTVPWSRRNRYTRRLRRFFSRQLVVGEENRRLVLDRDPEVQRIDSRALDWLRQFWGILRRETRSGSAYLELSLDGLVKPILESNRAYEEARRTRRSRYWAVLIVLLIPAVFAASWMLSQTENAVRRVGIASITRYADKDPVPELHDGNPATVEPWEPAERRAKLSVTLEENIELVGVFVVPGHGGFSPQKVRLGEGIGLGEELDVTTRPGSDSPDLAAYCCNNILTLIIDLPENERTLSMAEIEIWGRDPATNTSHQGP